MPDIRPRQLDFARGMACDILRGFLSTYSLKEPDLLTAKTQNKLLAGKEQAQNM